MIQRLVTGLLMLAVLACAQRRVDPKNTYHRVICVVPLIGTGAAGDPRRPQYAPLFTATHTAATTVATTAAPTPAPTDIIAYTQVPTDDGKFAIVEFVATDRKAFQAILADSAVTSFEKGVASKTAIESALKKVKKGFSLDNFGVVMP